MSGDWARRLFVSAPAKFREGTLHLICPDREFCFGDPAGDLRATVTIDNPRFFRRALAGGEVGIGESFVDGDWSSPDLVSVIRLSVRNMERLEGSNRALSLASRVFDTVSHWMRANTRAGSRRNISEHYDLGNEFFRLFLDDNLQYSAAWYADESDSLETAQIQKLDRICRKLRLEPGDHLLEIGSGWGGLALHAARHYGCRVTTTTISREQYEYARDLFHFADKEHRIELLHEDYRNLQGTGRYSKLVSVEMFEAVGLAYYDEYFRTCDRLLDRDGAMLLQAITLREQNFAGYRRRSDWIRRYIFPGSELASPSEMLRSLARATELSLFHSEDLGYHYAMTIHAWRERFHAAREQVLALGFDERFFRTWDYYLAYCEGAFLERRISDLQFLLTKNASRARLFQEPCETEAEIFI